MEANTGTTAATLPVRVFVASTPGEWLPMRVLEFSIRETTTLPVELAAIYQFERPIAMPRAVENRPRTPFSFQRFLIPELCHFKGRAIYMDADMQVFRDIGGLWNQPFAGCDLLTVQEAGDGRRGQFSVMLLDCEKLGWNVDRIVEALDSGELNYATLMYEMRVAKQIGRSISTSWNCLERYDPATTSLLHYTDMDTQPWVSTANPLGYLWIACLRRALASGFISRDEISREIAAGHVRPSLLAQLDSDIDDTLLLPAAIQRQDRNFVAPYKYLQCQHSRPWTSPVSALRALLKRVYYHTPLPALLKSKQRH